VIGALGVAVAIIAFFVWRSQRLPVGVEPMGDEADVAKIALYTAILGAVTAALSLLREVVSLFKKDDD